MLFVSKLPKTLYSVVVETMAYLDNRSLAQDNNGTTPLKCITGEKPDLLHLMIFDCPVNVVLLKEKRKKWDACSQMGYMVEYKPYLSGYLSWYLGMNCIEKAQDVLFHEDAIAPAIHKLYGNDKPEDATKSNLKGTRMSTLSSITSWASTHPTSLYYMHPTKACTAAGQSY